MLVSCSSRVSRSQGGHCAVLPEGYRPGDPRIRPAAEGRTGSSPLPAEVDVLIVGSGPAGLLLAAQLSEFPEIVTRVVEKADGPFQVGRADGVNCRTVRCSRLSVWPRR